MNLFWTARQACSVSLLKALLAEFMGTTVFLFASLTSVIAWCQPTSHPMSQTATAPTYFASSPQQPSTTGQSILAAMTRPPGVQAPGPQMPTDPIHISLTFGISVALMSYCTCSLSGGHLNPAVTVAMLVAVKVRPGWAFCYILAQLLGAIAASLLLYVLTPEQALGDLGINKLSPGVTPLQALGVETIVSFQLVLCVFVTSVGEQDTSKCGHFIVGLSVTLGNLVAIRYTGCGMNPARTFGPAVVMSVFTNHWVFWLGPVLGGLSAAVFHDFILAPKWSSFRDCLRTLNQGFQEGKETPHSAENNLQEIGLHG